MIEQYPAPPQNTRFGFHYFPDSHHYRESDLDAWLPELRALGATWLTMVAPHDRAVPENFLRRVISAGIEPVLHFHLPPATWRGNHLVHDLGLLFKSYGQWGVHYAVLFDRPNAITSWPAQAWAQTNLVERFLDLYLPLAEAAVQAGLFPVFPPLEPGGDYWDTAFLHLALRGIQRRARPNLLEKLVLGAYAWTGNHPLNWGAGGPERWPAARPYETPATSEDQRGFRIFDWYFTLAQAALQRTCPVLIVAGGCRNSKTPNGAARHARLNLAIASLMDPKNLSGEPGLYDPFTGDLLEPVPAEVLACNFWLLAAHPESPASADAWFQAEGYSLPVVGALKQNMAMRRDELPLAPQLPSQEPLAQPPSQPDPQNFLDTAPDVPLDPVTLPPTGDQKPIGHYLLLPSFDWGVSDWHLDIIRPFVKKYHPTVGYSPEEATYARRVTVVGDPASFSGELLARLRSAGCMVDVIGGDGTNIATILAMI